MKNRKSFNWFLAVKTLILTAFLLFGITTWAQPTIQWQKCFGGTSSETARSVQQTTDGGYIIAGETFSNDGDVSGNHGLSDYLIIKTNSIGAIQWRKCLGGTSWDVAYSIQQTTDGGYIVAGYTYSNDGDVLGNHGFPDFWTVKLDSSGSIQWRKCLGGTSWDVAYSIQQTTDGGYIVAGYTYSNDEDVSGNHDVSSLFPDCWIVKLDFSGAIQWQKCLGGTSGEITLSIQQTTDGGYIVAGETDSDNGDVSGNHNPGFSDCWVVKLDPLGIIQWQRCLGGTSDEITYFVQQTIDGGYVIAGGAFSNDGDVSGNHGSIDGWIVKLDSLGIIQWQKCLGGTDDDYASSIQQTTDGGYVVAGYTYSNDGDVSENHGSLDGWIIKLNFSGTIQWQKCLGGTKNDEVNSIQQITDGCIISGGAFSNDGDVSGNHGSYDYWIVKLSSLSSVQEENPLSDINVYPNPFVSQINIKISDKTPINVELFDPTGRIVCKTTGVGSMTIKTDNLSHGIYLLKILSKGEISNTKIIKY